MNEQTFSSSLPVLGSHHKKESDTTDQLNIRKEISVWGAAPLSPCAVTHQDGDRNLRRRCSSHWAGPLVRMWVESEPRLSAALELVLSQGFSSFSLPGKPKTIEISKAEVRPLEGIQLPITCNLRAKRGGECLITCLLPHPPLQGLAEARPLWREERQKMLGGKEEEVWTASYSLSA